MAGPPPTSSRNHIARNSVVVVRDPLPEGLLEAAHDLVGVPPEIVPDLRREGGENLPHVVAGEHRGVGLVIALMDKGVGYGRRPRVQQGGVSAQLRHRRLPRAAPRQFNLRREASRKAPIREIRFPQEPGSDLAAELQPVVQMRAVR